nr:right-handed parallel beta-helix repeat-containing protein [Clostridia bacterium]
VRAFSLSTPLRFNTLYHPERQIETPRYPEEGSFTVRQVDQEDELFPGNQGWWEASNGCTAFYADPQEVGISFSQPEEVYCRITHAWLDEIARIRFYEDSTGRVGLGRPATYEVKQGDVYWFENVFESLDSPGEWYLDESAGTLYYVPFDGETAEGLTLYAPVSEHMLYADGCIGLSFEGIRFCRSEWTLAAPSEDAGTRYEYDIDAYQASTDCDAAVNVKNSDGITFCSCEFIDIGNTALRFIKNCRDCGIRNCIFRRIGSTAIAIYGENVAPDADNADEAMSGFTVENNLIEAYGRNTYESTGVHLMYVKDSDVRHNEIHDGYYTGLSCGWIWGHEYQVTKNIQITDNLIYDIGQGWLSDLGGMYLLGEQEGTVIARNVIYNVTRGMGVNDYGGNGLYTDAGSSYFTIEQNLIYDCACTGINIGGFNRGHTVRNNISAFCKLSAFDPGFGDGSADDSTCDCYNNIFCSDHAPVILDVSPDAAYTERENLLWDYTEGDKVFGSDGHSGNYENKIKIGASDARKNGFLLTDVVADPMFADPAGRDFTFKPGSPALTGGIAFEVYDFTKSGISADEIVGCGSEYSRGSVFRANDLSVYPDGCEKSLMTYGALTLLRRIFVNLPAVLLTAGAVLYLLAVRRKKTLKKARRILLPTAPPVMLALLWPMYRVFVVSWQPVFYGICLGAFVISAGTAIWLSVKRAPLRIAVIVFSTAASWGLTFLINNVLHIDTALALGAGETALAAAVFAAAAAFFLSRS